MLFFIILGRLLTPDDFGVVAIASVFLLSCQLLLRSGFGVAIIQRDELEPGHLNAAFWGNLAVAALLAALLLAGSAPTAAALGEPTLTPVLAALAPSLLPSGAAWIFHARFRREMRYDLVAWSTFASTLGGGLVGVFLAITGAGVWSLVGQQLSGATFPLIVLVACSSWRPGLRFSRSHLRDIALFSVKVVAGHALEFASQRVIPLILAFFVSTHAVGLYVIASRLMWTSVRLPTYLICDLSLVVLSRLSGEPERHREGAYYTFRIIGLLCVPLSVGAAFVADPLIPMLFGAHWTESVPLFQILSVLSIFFVLYYGGQQVLISAGRAEPALRLAVVRAIMVPAFTLGAAPFGIVAATVAAGAAWFASLPIAVRVLRLELGLGVRRLLADQCPIWLATGFMAVALSLLRLAEPLEAAHPAALLAVQVVCGAVVFTAAMLLLAPNHAREVVATLRDALGRRAPEA